MENAVSKAAQSRSVKKNEPIKRASIPHDGMSENKRLMVENDKLYLENMILRRKLKESGVDIINIAYTYVIRILFVIFGGFITLELLYMLENALGL